MFKIMFKIFDPCNYCSSKDNVNNKLTMLNIMHLVRHYIILTVKCKICCIAIVNNANFIFGWCAPQNCTLHPINFVNPHPMRHVENDCLHKKNIFIFVLGESNSPGFTSIVLPEWKGDNFSWVFLPIGIIAPWIAVLIICWINRRAVQHPSFTRKCQTYVFIK